MNLRNIVPALALAAVTAAPAMAADAMPAVSFEGWVDTILTISDDDSDDIADTAKDEESATIRFTGDASLKANWKVTDALTARINLWFDADFAELQMREAYFAWAINDTVTWSMGKYIDHLGWIAAEPTGLYTINASLIGYTSTYGNDVIGTSIGVAPKDSPISGSFHITNGYYTASDATNGGPSTSRENTDLGFGLDLIYNLPNDMGSLNLELAYDMSSDLNGDGFDENDPTDPTDDEAGMGGDVFLIGFNATIKPAKPVLIGAEIQYLTVGEGQDIDGDDLTDTGFDRLQGLVLVNYAIEGASIPMSVSGMIQYVMITSDDDAPTVEDEERFGISAALLTNPLTSSNFGLNFELGYWDATNIGFTDGADNNGIVFAVEGLVTF